MPLEHYLTGKKKHKALEAKFKVVVGGAWTDAMTMKAYSLTPTQWYELPRSERVFMAAARQAEKALDAMQQYDYAEDARQEAERKAKAKRRK